MSDNAFSGDKPKNQYPIYGSKREVESGDQPQDRYFCKRECFYKIFEMSLIVDYDLIGTHFEAFVSKSP